MLEPSKEIVQALDWCQDNHMSIHFHDGWVTIRWQAYVVGQGESFVYAVQEAQKLKYEVVAYREDGTVADRYLYRKGE